MLLHCVFLNFSDDVSTDRRMEVLSALAALTEEVDGMLAFAYGPNRDFERKTPDHGEGFVITFRDRAAHLAYERHPTHRALGAQLEQMCEGGADGIAVYDIDCM
ncbi:MAG: Dabb family protein [Pseudomonadota bacterium]